jgi:hypothetical protein
MRTHSGSIDIPRRTYQTLGEIREPTGWERVTPAELARREAIERRHDGDDGTLTHYERQHGDRREYLDGPPDPISDLSPIHVLAYYGLGTREIELLERHGCETVGDVRAAICDGDVVAWRQLEEPTRDKIAEAVEMVPKNPS